MIVSKNKLKKISSRIRKGLRNEEDLVAIEDYRDSRLGDLAYVLSTINKKLQKEGVPFLVSGRPKRLKSILRKLERMPGANLATLADIVGARVIVDSLEVQTSVYESLKSVFDLRDIKDYRLKSHNGYHAIHLYVDTKNRSVVEVQLRTLPQQLWANESESLGERVKEGAGDHEQIKYLKELSRQCFCIDNNIEVPLTSTSIGKARNTLQHMYQKLIKNWESAIKSNSEFFNYLLVYDSYTRELLSLDPYTKNEEQEIKRQFCRKTRELKQDRYDVLWLNSTSKDALRVTHPIFFPS